MQRKSVIGYPRVGKLRELKFATEQYFKSLIEIDSLEEIAKNIRKEQWLLQKEAEIDFISSNDFSYYDGVLDTIIMLGAIPKKYRELNLSEIDTYFAMARGYQKGGKDVTSLSMKKWFNTNYHYLVPVLEDGMEFSLNINKLLSQYKEALDLGIKTKPSIIGPFTFLQLSRYSNGKTVEDFKSVIRSLYGELLLKVSEENIEYIQIEEPYLVTDLSKGDIELFQYLYEYLLSKKGECKVILQTYFGDIRDIYKEVCELSFDGIGLDLVEGLHNLDYIKKYGFPKDTLLFAGVINGKNIWKNQYEQTIQILNELKNDVKEEQIVLNTSCSLLHVPYTLENETHLTEHQKKYFAFAKEKLGELKELAQIGTSKVGKHQFLELNRELFKEPRVKDDKNQVILKESDFQRSPDRKTRRAAQKSHFNLPVLPTTTIGSFPQTEDVKKLRTQFKKGEISKIEYDKAIKAKIARIIEIQEEIGLDVLVHGEYERNDMVEYFGENLEGFIFTEKAWVQSYGTRCVKPPIIWSDVYRKNPITVEYIKYAQSLTSSPVKGMLTGPVTILNWSFPREDISLENMAYQIAAAIREEVLDLERAGIRIIQVDEAALKEKLPLRKVDWYPQYLEWAIKAFRLVHSGVDKNTQIHTHMCYSEFQDIINEIDQMDADVISFETSKSAFDILDSISNGKFETEVGPGVYDIHSPRIPSVEELEAAIRKILQTVEKDRVWMNPDCGLKTRKEEETFESLRHMVKAARSIREEIKDKN